MRREALSFFEKEGRGREQEESTHHRGLKRGKRKEEKRFADVIGRWKSRLHLIKSKRPIKKKKKKVFFLSSQNISSFITRHK